MTTIYETQGFITNKAKTAETVWETDLSWDEAYNQYDALRADGNSILESLRCIARQI